MMGPLNYCPPHTPGGDLRERGRYWFKALAVKLHGGHVPARGCVGLGSWSVLLTWLGPLRSAQKAGTG